MTGLATMKYNNYFNHEYSIINSVNSIKDAQTSFKTLSKKLDDEKEFKEVYRYTFNFAKDPGARNLNFDSARGKFLNCE